MVNKWIESEWLHLASEREIGNVFWENEKEFSEIWRSASVQLESKEGNEEIEDLIDVQRQD